MDWIMQTLTQLGEHFGLVLIACVELAAAVALLDRRSDQVFIRDTRLDKKTVYKWWNIKK